MPKVTTLLRWDWGQYLIPPGVADQAYATADDYIVLKGGLRAMSVSSTAVVGGESFPILVSD